MGLPHQLEVLRYRLWQLSAAPGYVLTNTLPLWKLRNRAAFSAFKDYVAPLPAPHQVIVDRLERDGIATARLEDFFPEDPDRLSLLMRAAEEGISAGARQTNAKQFLRYFFRSDREPVDSQHPFMELSLTPAFLEIMSAYFATFAHLEYVTGNIALPATDGRDPETSQRWHRDPGVYKNCKIFVYLTDVDEGSGPFTYVRGSQPGGAVSRAAAHRFFGVGSYYPKDAVVGQALESADMQKRITPCVGKAGTVIFANTMGLHRGGYARDRERHMLTFYYRPVPREEPLLKCFSNPPAIETLPRIVQEALSPQGARTADAKNIDALE